MFELAHPAIALSSFPPNLCYHISVLLVCLLKSVYHYCDDDDVRMCVSMVRECSGVPWCTFGGQRTGFEGRLSAGRDAEAGGSLWGREKGKEERKSMLPPP